jgi:dienelactone hydrolase
MGARRFFENESFDFDFRLAIGSAAYRCAEVGECLATAARIRDSDIDSWFDEWMAVADRLRAVAEAAEAKGHAPSARDAWLRASKYAATAFFYVLGTRDPSRSLATWEVHRAAFDRAIALWPTPAAKVAIPYEGTTLEGCWLAPAGGGPRPLAILNNGSDGTAVDMISMGAVAALERGWHALIFDGPGQGAALYRQRLPFRHDWVDFALARTDVDPNRIALLGVSQAGYWVPRAAAFEPRVAAAVADPGVMRVWTSWFDNLPPKDRQVFDRGDREAFDAGVVAALPQLPAAARFNFAKRREPFLTDSFFDLLTEVKRYDLTADVGRIRCPTLVTDPEGEQFWPGQSQEVYDALTWPKALIRFTAAEGADGHWESLAPALRNQRVFDWLDETLRAGGA